MKDRLQPSQAPRRAAVLAASAFLLACWNCAPAFSDERPPNVVLFLVDDMGWMDSSAYGSQYYETPNMERLAELSMRFTDAYALPLCSPSRASILTGQYSARHGVTSASGHRPPAPDGQSRYPEKAAPTRQFLYADSKNYLDPELITIAEVLREAGYRTGHFGKWHLGLMPRHWPDQQGFETTWHCAPDPGPPSYFSPYGVHPEGQPSPRHRVGNITDGPDGEYITDRVTEEALQFVDRHRDEPFLLHLWHYGVHGPWGHKEEYTAEFADKRDPRGKQNNPIMASMLKSIDQSLGRVMNRLDALGLTENTLFIFYSDNGGNTHSNTPDSRQMRNITPGHPRWPMVQDWKKWAGAQPPTNNAPLREGKGRIYEGGQRVPLMVRWPGRIRPGTTSDAVVGPIDLYPTILDALGLQPPAKQVIDGVSFLPVLKETGHLERQAYFAWFPHLIPAVSVRQGDWKLIRRFEPHGDYPETRELYNLEQDLGETKNLAASRPQEVKRLDALIDQFIAETGALAPKPNSAYDPQAATAARSPAAGLVPKMSTISLVDGALRMQADGRTPFLGTAQVKHTGPMILTLRVRSEGGGAGEVRWKKSRQDSFPRQQSVAFQLPKSSQWRDITVDLPVQGRTQIVRLYLPAKQGPVDIGSIRFTAKSTRATVREWSFVEENSTSRSKTNPDAAAANSEKAK